MLTFSYTWTSLRLEQKVHGFGLNGLDYDIIVCNKYLVILLLLLILIHNEGSKRYKEQRKTKQRQTNCDNKKNTLSHESIQTRYYRCFLH